MIPIVSYAFDTNGNIAYKTYEGEGRNAQKKVLPIVDVCEAFAEESPYPTLDKVYEYVYSEPNYPFIDKLEN